MTSGDVCNFVVFRCSFILVRKKWAVSPTYNATQLGHTGLHTIKGFKKDVILYFPGHLPFVPSIFGIFF